MSLLERLFALQDSEYADFQAKLTPTIARDCFIGIRVPILRQFAKEFFKEPAAKEFLQELPHRYFDENMLHGLLLEQIKDFDVCIEELERFLPYVDNWAVCDIMTPKILKKYPEKTLFYLKKWAASSETYTCRFGLELLMAFYLDDEFAPELLEIPAVVRSEEYYVNMMVAWFFATALAKQWDAALPYLTDHRLAVWTHNKTIQKAIESRRITDEQKAFLRTLKRFAGPTA